MNICKKNFVDNGYCIINLDLNNQILNCARKSFINILQKAKKEIYKKVRVYDDYTSVANIAGIENIFDKDIIDQDILNLINESNIVNLAKFILDEDDIVLNLSRYHVTNDHTHLGIWHRDEEPNNLQSVQINVYLYDETGMDIIPNSHKRKNTEEEDMVFNKCRYSSLKQSTTVSVGTGEVLAFDPSIIHRGKTKKNRAHLHFRFTKKVALPKLEDKTHTLNHLNLYNINPNLKNILLSSAKHGYTYDCEVYSHKKNIKSQMLRILRYIIHNFFFFLSYQHKIYSVFNVRPCLKKRNFFNII
jgi:ectoine hydroxylase-related dioxygenase (phytanoyl-CoA dioxygenase family)